MEKSDDKALFQEVTVVRYSEQKRGKESSDLQSEMDLAVELCKQGLQERFSNLLEASSEKLNKEKSTANTIVCDMLVFNVDTWSHDIDSLLDLGSDEVARLAWFRPVPREWVSLKVMVKRQFQDMAYSRLWATMFTKEPYKSDYENVLHLVELLLVLPISSAVLEGIFHSKSDQKCKAFLLGNRNHRRPNSHIFRGSSRR